MLSIISPLVFFLGIMYLLPTQQGVLFISVWYELVLTLGRIVKSLNSVSFLTSVEELELLDINRHMPHGNVLEVLLVLNYVRFE